MIRYFYAKEMERGNQIQKNKKGKKNPELHLSLPVSLFL